MSDWHQTSQHRGFSLEAWSGCRKVTILNTIVLISVSPDAFVYSSENSCSKAKCMRPIHGPGYRSNIQPNGVSPVCPGDSLRVTRATGGRHERRWRLSKIHSFQLEECLAMEDQRVKWCCSMYCVRFTPYMVPACGTHSKETVLWVMSPGPNPLLLQWRTCV